MLRLLLLFLPPLLLACNKPEANPEARDPLYQELQSQKSLVTKLIADTQKKLEEKKTELNSVKPQTGQIKYAQKRLWETQRALDTLIQQEKYWTLRISEREKVARTDYLKAFREGKPWPDPKEFEEYSVEKRLREAKQDWDQKKRIEKYKLENPMGGVAPAGSEAAKPATEASE